MKQIDKQAAVISVGIAGLGFLIGWSLGNGPDWILPAIICGVALALLFRAIYTILETR